MAAYPQAQFLAPRGGGSVGHGVLIPEPNSGAADRLHPSALEKTAEGGMSGLPLTLPAPATGCSLFAGLLTLAHPEPVCQQSPWPATPCPHLPPNSPCFVCPDRLGSCSGVPAFPWLFTGTNSLRCAQSPSYGPGPEGPWGPTLRKPCCVLAGGGHAAAFVPSTSAGVAPKRLSTQRAALSNSCSRTAPLFQLLQRVTLTRHLLLLAESIQVLQPRPTLEGTRSASLANLELGLRTHPCTQSAVMGVIIRG